MWRQSHSPRSVAVQGTPPFDQHDAEAFFEELDALRDGGGRDVQNLRRLLETAGLNHHGDGAQGGIVDHGLVPLNRLYED